jgi:hypothetical protein
LAVSSCGENFSKVFYVSGVSAKKEQLTSIMNFGKVYWPSVVAEKTFPKFFMSVVYLQKKEQVTSIMNFGKV